MIRRKKVGYFLLSLLLLLVFSSTTRISGFTVFEFYKNFFVLSLIYSFLLIVSLLLVSSRISLDMMLIPGLVNEKKTRERTRVALNSLSEYDPKIIVASGGKTPGLPKKYTSEAQIIYEELRKERIPPSRIRIDARSRDSVENFLNSVKKGPHSKIGIVANPGQLDRFEYILEAAKKEGEIDVNTILYRIETPENTLERSYDLLGRKIDRHKLRKGVKNYNTFPNFFKRAINYLFRRI